MTITIYGIAKSRAFRNLWMAEELGLPYKHEHIEFTDESLRGKAFRAINPMMQIPALEDGGEVFTESLAINIYLAEKQGGPLAPHNASERGQVAMWTLFAATQIEQRALDVFYNRHLKPEAERDAALAKAQMDALQRPLHFLDGALQRTDGTLIEGRFTVADINLGCCLFYLRKDTDLYVALPHLARWWQDITKRPAYHRAMALRGEKVE
ncbi:MAG: glutathione S-transferase family protein [Beijerinckiaceae bacterium]